MGRETNISWTDSTWNAIRGCSRVSEGCRHCYAESIAHRFSGPGLAYEGLVQLDAEGKSTGKWNGKIKFLEEHLLDPLRWKKPRRIFVNSMSDLFHENVTDEMRDKIFAVMALCPQHTFQILTKRPERMLAYLNDCADDRGYNKSVTNPRAWKVWCEATKIQAGAKRPIPGPFGWTTFDDVDTVKPWPLPNVHLGVSVEDQKTADLRIPLLLQTPAAVRFISAEPLLGRVSLARWTDEGLECGYCGWFGLECDATEAGPEDDRGYACPRCGEICAHTPLNERLGDGLAWVIVGGESGAGARPMHPDWARSLRDQCKAAGVPFFFKQWGAWGPLENGETTLSGYDMDLTTHTFRDDSKPRSAWEDVFLTNAKTNGCLLDGVEHHEFPAVSA